MNPGQFRVSRRSATIAVAMVALVSVAIGAHAALYKRAPETASAMAAVAIDAAGDMVKKGARVALVIGNGHYPDASAPLAQPINDARAMTAALRRDGFDVDMVEDATRDDMVRAVARLNSKIQPDSVVMLYFGGFGVQSRGDSYMIPVDAAIWQESDVRRDGMSIASVLAAVKEKGAKTKLAVIDASRRNPYERRFRTYSHGLAALDAPDNTLILSSAASGKVVDDARSANSLLVTELLKNIDLKVSGAEAVFGKTRAEVSRLSGGEQIPALSSSLVNDVAFGSGDAGVANKTFRTQ
jgi:uncharacterized caspase-like protein